MGDEKFYQLIMEKLCIVPNKFSLEYNLGSIWNNPSVNIPNFTTTLAQMNYSSGKSTVNILLDMWESKTENWHRSQKYQNSGSNFLAENWNLKMKSY